VPNISPLSQLIRRIDARTDGAPTADTVPTGFPSIVVRGLKTLAVEQGVAVVLAAHLPAFRRDRHDRRPTLDDFGALDAIKQHADVVLGLFREEMYESAQNVEGATELLTLKNRNGATGYVDLYFYKQWLRFEDLLER
jgi:replicative DNA helicase